MREAEFQAMGKVEDALAHLRAELVLLELTIEELRKRMAR